MRLLIVEDSGFIIDSMVKLLAFVPSLTIIGQTASRDEALQAVSALHPDIVVLDLRIKDTADGMPNPEHGLTTLREMRRLNPSPKVIVFTWMPEERWFRPVAQAGAVGFVSKDSSSSEIITALQAVSSGMTAFTPSQIDLLQESTISVSEREYEVLSLLAKGLSDEEIGRQLGISGGTTRKHVEHLRSIFGVHNRVQLITAAQRAGLLPSEL
jgi:two-component system, NarL family, response regulator DevR